MFQLFSQKRFIDSKKRHVFVTGDLGKLGGMIAKDLKRQCEVVGFDLQRSEKENLLNYAYLKKRMKGAEFVVHCAAIPHPNPGLSFNEYFKINVTGTHNVIQAAVENKVKRLVYISSTAYFGCNTSGKVTPLYFPIDEKHPPATTMGITDGKLSHYGQSKVMAEQMCAYYGTNDLIEVVVLRSAPANESDQQYQKDFDWKKDESYRRGSFWAYNPPNNLVQAVRLAIKSKDRFRYEPFIIANKYAPKIIKIETFINKEYPRVPLKKLNLKKNQGLFDISKAEKVLGFVPED